MRRRILPVILIFFAFVFAVNCQTKTADEKAESCKYLSFAEAEKILGRQVELVTNSWTFTREKTRFDCAYRAKENDAASGREVNLFFMVEESADATAARQVYETIWQSNKNHQGIEFLSGVGDEAYTQSNTPNFYFVMARKGRFTIRLKINKAVETTSLNELKAFAKKVVEEIRG